jgi:hypothetical protein
LLHGAKFVFYRAKKPQSSQNNRDNDFFEIAEDWFGGPQPSPAARSPTARSPTARSPTARSPTARSQRGRNPVRECRPPRPPQLPRRQTPQPRDSARRSDPSSGSWRFEDTPEPKPTQRAAGAPLSQPFISAGRLESDAPEGATPAAAATPTVARPVVVVDDDDDDYDFKLSFARPSTEADGGDLLKYILCPRVPVRPDLFYIHPYSESSEVTAARCFKTFSPEFFFDKKWRKSPKIVMILTLATVFS